MEIESISNPIASRTYHILGGGKVQVILGKPEQFPEGEGIDGFYYCPFQIVGIETGKIMHSSGFDQVQAIWSAMKMIGAILHTSDVARSGKLKWAGELDEDKFGFPEP